VLDEVGAGPVTLVSWCCPGDDLILATEHPDRVTGLVLIAPDLLLQRTIADELAAACNLENRGTRGVPTNADN
jgi:hypothetical protein